MKPKQKSNNIRLGILVVLSTALLIIAFYFIGSNKSMFGKTINLSAEFRNTNGLQKGNNVRYSGINIGTVDEIELISDTSIRVIMIIETELQKVIKEDAIASIGTDGLMGNKLINIEPGTQGGDFIKDGGTIRSLKTVNTEEMLRTLEFTNENVALVSANLKTITEDISNKKGTLYSVLLDSTLADELRSSIYNMKTISNNLTVTTDIISGLLKETKEGKGMLGMILKDTALSNGLQSSIYNMDKTTQSLNKTASDIQLLFNNSTNEKGSVSLLLNDSVTAGNLKNGIENFNAAVIKLNEDLEGLKHSILLRSYFRKQQKKNLK